MMLRQPISYRSTIALGITSVLISLLFYTWLSHRQHDINPDDKSIPTWGQMYDGFVQITTPHYRSKEIWLLHDSQATAVRLFLALGFSIIVALILGILGCITPFQSFMRPPLSFASQIPPPAILAVFFAFLPIINDAFPMMAEYNLYVVMIAFGLIPALTERIYLAIRDVPDELIYKAYTLGSSHTEVAIHVIFRMILPRLIDGIKAQIGPAMVYLIAAEMLISSEGFGYRIRLQSRLVNMDIVYPYIIVLAGFGFGLHQLLKGTQKVLCPWFGKKA